MSEERPIGELLAYLGGLGYTELYRRGERREARDTRPRETERAPARSARGEAPSRSPGRVPAPPHTPGPMSSPGPPSPPEPRQAPGPAAPPRAARTGPSGGVSPFDEIPGPALPAAERARRLELLRQETLRCRICRLCRDRSQVVFGEGYADADLMFVGEGPGADEDRQGMPFVGAAGQLLTKIIQAIELDRTQVYIANVVKCRPPGNRDPEHDEIDACLPHLVEQIDLVRPRLIVALGRVAARTLLHTAAPITQMRGSWFKVRGADLRVTYHPAALLRDEGLKRPTWDDMKIVRDRLKELREQGPKS